MRILFVCVLFLSGCGVTQAVQKELDKKAFLLRCGNAFCVGGNFDNKWYMTELKSVEQLKEASIDKTTTDGN